MLFSQWIDYGEQICYNIHISIKFGYGRTQFNRVYQSVICNYADGTFFVFRPIYLGHKPAVFRDCWLLLYIKAAIPSEKKGA
ncbi:hypothetical protein DRZ84_01000 [Enterococcus faecium]|nr:hypothetical protein DRZ84_01000 [Enterococcus faecium]